MFQYKCLIQVDSMRALQIILLPCSRLGLYHVPNGYLVSVETNVHIKATS